MELAWNTQKNQMTDVKGKENEQERKGRMRNEDIDQERTKHNYDLVKSDKNLYQRVKERVDYAKETGSRVQKNSVVMYSNVLTVPEQQAKEWGGEKTKDYFKACHDYFSKEFGHENVVSAKVHLDETAPHMHLHFVPFNKETGKLQARVAMDRKKVNQIHNDLPAFLRERGFDVERGSGKTKDKNIENVHEYKTVQKKIQEKKNELQTLLDAVPDKKERIPYLEKETKTETVKKGFFQKETTEKETGNYVLTPDQYKEMNRKVHAAVTIKKDYQQIRNTDLAIERDQWHDIALEEMEKAMDAREKNKELEKENKELKNKVVKLQRDIKTIYVTTREFLKERTNDLKSFRAVFKGYIDSLKGNTAKVAKNINERPEKNEFEVVHGQFEKIQEKKMDRGMQR